MSVITMNIKINNKIQHGFTLVEVMVAMVIFSVGLLGLAGLQSLGMTNNQTAYNRTVAMQMAYNMSDRMRANISAVNAGTYTLLATDVPAAQDCIQNTCTSDQIRQFDILEWRTTIAAELPQGLGSITPNVLATGGQQFVVCVMWNELKVPAAVLTVPACTGAYNPAADYKYYTLTFEL